MAYHKIYVIPKIILCYNKFMKELTKSLENYLTAIFEIIKANGAARVRDVSERVSTNAASTSEAVKSLARKGYINYKPYGVITLTEKGLQTAEEKSGRHIIIENFLENILMLKKDYAQDLEFSMPDEVLNRFVDYLTFMQKCSCKEPKWLRSFQEYTRENKMPEKCLNCKSGCCNCR